ncbi:Protein of unknown function DUF86, Caur_2869 group [uncultured Gammaproteobacteria bacterium]|nr:Protein of unknown function DUF86, Caur_2869 group [uncultured Gammaproteobacteria bacterium]
MNNDIRWKQRFQNFEQAFEVFNRRKNDYETDPSSESHQMSFIQAYEILFELSWKVMKDYLENEGYEEVTNAKKTIRHAFQDGLIRNAEDWMEGIKKRNMTSHTYNENVLMEVVEFINTVFYHNVRDLYYRLKKEL